MEERVVLGSPRSSKCHIPPLRNVWIPRPNIWVRRKGKYVNGNWKGDRNSNTRLIWLGDVYTCPVGAHMRALDCVCVCYKRECCWRYFLYNLKQLLLHLVQQCSPIRRCAFAVMPQALVSHDPFLVVLFLRK